MKKYYFILLFLLVPIFFVKAQGVVLLDQDTVTSSERYRWTLVQVTGLVRKITEKNNFSVMWNDTTEEKKVYTNIISFTDNVQIEFEVFAQAERHKGFVLLLTKDNLIVYRRLLGKKHRVFIGKKNQVRLVEMLYFKLDQFCVKKKSNLVNH